MQNELILANFVTYSRLNDHLAISYKIMYIVCTWCIYLNSAKLSLIQMLYLLALSRTVDNE